MDRFRLAEWMRHPEEMEYEELQELESLVERYPYFQVVRMLYLKALYVQKSLRFPRELAKGTVHITDRKQLLRYLNLQEEDFYAVPAEPVRVPEAETPVAPPVIPEPVAAPAPVRKTVARTLDLNLDEEDEPLTAETEDGEAAGGADRGFYPFGQEDAEIDGHADGYARPVEGKPLSERGTFQRDAGENIYAPEII